MLNSWQRPIRDLDSTVQFVESNASEIVESDCSERLHATVKEEMKRLNAFTLGRSEDRSGKDRLPRASKSCAECTSLTKMLTIQVG